jgi:FAD/FMN-containing dehydrogenase
MTLVLEEETSTGIAELRARLRGVALMDGDSGYDGRRAVWNARFDRRPAMIVVPQGTGDVAEAVRFARARGLAVSVKGGGHGAGGWAVANGGLMIDLSGWKAAEVDPINRTARVRPGLTSSELNRATMEHALATPGGKVGSVGIAGSTLGGGIGWIARKHGLAIDHLRSVEIVTGDGQIRTASETENIDLFWGVRGAGSALGVVTAFEFDLVPMSMVLAGFLAYPLELAPQLVQAHRALTAGAPDELTSVLALASMPNAGPLAMVAVTWCGDLTEGERVLEPIRSLATPVLDMIAPMPYGALQAEMAKMALPGLSHELKSAYVDGCTDELFLTMAEHYRSAPVAQMTTMLIEHYGGAVARVSDDAMAFGNRTREFNLLVETGWTDPAQEEATAAWLDRTWNALRPQTLPAAYVNFLDLDDSHRAVESFGGEKYRRILDLKAIYDPDSLFRSNPVTPVLP